MSQLSRIDEATDIFTRLFNGLAQLSGKQLSARQREAIHHACELLAEGEPLDELAEFDDIVPATMPRLNPNNAPGCVKKMRGETFGGEIWSKTSNNQRATRRREVIISRKTPENRA